MSGAHQDPKALRRLGLLVAAIGLVSDQAVKLWLLFGLDMQNRPPIELLPFFDVVAVWNYGISYGLFQQESDLGRAVLLGITVVALVFLIYWLWQAGSRVAAISLGLVIGGAIGNGIDRAVYGAVYDFAHFHIGSFSWYIFNLADVWIVAGVAGLLYDAFTTSPEKATNRD